MNRPKKKDTSDMTGATYATFNGWNACHDAFTPYIDGLEKEIGYLKSFEKAEERLKAENHKLYGDVQQSEQRVKDAEDQNDNLKFLLDQKRQRVKELEGALESNFQKGRRVEAEHWKDKLKQQQERLKSTRLGEQEIEICLEEMGIQEINYIESPMDKMYKEYSIKDLARAIVKKMEEDEGS